MEGLLPSSRIRRRSRLPGAGCSVSPLSLQPSKSAICDQASKADLRTAHRLAAPRQGGGVVGPGVSSVGVGGVGSVSVVGGGIDGVGGVSSGGGGGCGAAGETALGGRRDRLGCVAQQQPPLRAIGARGITLPALPQLHPPPQRHAACSHAAARCICRPWGGLSHGESI